MYATGLSSNIMKSGACRICGQDTEPLFKMPVSPTQNITDMYKCRSCGAVFAGDDYPFSSEKEYYAERYHESKPAEYWYKARIGVFRHCLKRIDSLESGRRGRMLDVGCGMGYFLDLAAKDGWQTYGIEVSDSAADYAVNQMKMKVFKGELREAGCESDFFDVVTMWNTLDQLIDPKETLLEAQRILKPGGLIILRAVNLDFQMALYKIRSMAKYAGLRDINKALVFHLYSFNKRSIKRALDLCGFTRDITVEASPMGPESEALVSIFGKKGERSIRFLAENTSRLLGACTFNTIILSPSIIAHARKGQDR